MNRGSDARNLLLLLILATLAGCRSPYHSDRLGLFGGATGAGIGAAIGEANGRPAEGALIGAALGSLTGVAVGDHLDEVEARNQQAIQAQLGRPLAGAATIEDVTAMSSAGLSDEVIRTHVAHHGIARPLTAQDLIALKQQGVSDGVINTMQSPPPRPAPVHTRGPVVVEEHFYGPPAPWCGPRRFHHHRPGVHWGVSFGK